MEDISISVSKGASSSVYQKKKKLSVSKGASSSVMQANLQWDWLGKGLPFHKGGGGLNFEEKAKGKWETKMF